MIRGEPQPYTARQAVRETRIVVNLWDLSRRRGNIRSSPRNCRMPSNALPPGPKGTFIAGSLRDFTARRLDFFMDVKRDYGDIASFRFEPKRIFLISHPHPNMLLRAASLG